MEQKIINKKTILLIILILIFIATAIILFIFSNKTKTLEILSYTEKSNIDYQVCLKENNFYAEKCQPKGMRYIASAINNIDATFEYNFETSVNVDFTYQYYIDGIITVFNRNDSSNILFTKTVRLLDINPKEEKNRKTYNINEKLTIDYHNYNDLIRSFKSEYNISADSNLKLKLYIETTVNYKNFKNQMNTSDVMELTIPLTENTINIDMNYKEINTSDKFVQTADKTIVNKLYFILSLSFALLSIITILFLVITIFQKKKSKSEYEKFISSKIKNLDRLIVSVKDDVKLQEKDYKEIIDVRDFPELVDIAERLVDVITWTEVTHKKEKTSWFAVANDKRLYRIIYKSTDKEFK